MGLQSVTSRWLVTSQGVVRVATRLRHAGLGVVVDRTRAGLLRTAGPFELTLDDLRLQGTRPHDAHYFRWVGAGRERYLLDLIRSLLGPGMTVVDVGAYVGLITLTAARAVGPTGRVHAFEPHPDSCAILKENVERDGTGCVVVHEAALCDHDGRETLYIDPECERTSLYAGRIGSATATEVQVIRGDRVLPVPVDLVKIDAEGAELAVLRGMAATLRASDPVVIVECAPAVLGAVGHDAAELLASLHEMGFEVAVIDEQRQRLCAVEDGRSLFERRDGYGDEAYANLLCTRTRSHERVWAKLAAAQL